MSGCANVCGGTGGGGVASATFAAALQFLAHSQCLLTEPWPPQASLQNRSSVDVIIVGSGSAGSALAARLAETNLTVLLLEAGGDPPIESIVPRFKSALLRGQYDWNFTSVDDQYSSQELANHRQRLRTARILGGVGSINGMIYARAFPADLDQWADIVGDSTWNWNYVLPYFKKTENLTDKSVLDFPPSRRYHGYDGEIQVAGLDKENFDTIKLLEAFKELGFNVIEDRNNPEAIGAYHNSFTIKDGKRQSSLTAMLNKAAIKLNLHVMKNSLVTKILIRNNTAYGVKVSIGDDEWEFYANKEIVVSAGVYNTPKLLMLSGIGPKWHLQQFGIDVVSDLPVGSNLHDHLNSRTFLAAESGTCQYDEYEYFEAIKYLYNRTGLMSIPSRMGLDYALKGSLTPNVPDFSIFPECIPRNSNYYEECMHSLDFTHETCTYLDTINEQYELFPISVLLRKPKSRGTVRLASSNPIDKPIIRTGAFSNADDLEGFPEVFKVVWSLTNTSYFQSKHAFVVDLGLKSCEGLEWPESVKCAARGVAMSDAHGTGTAALGAALDGRLQVRGVRALRVADASAMPAVPRANINAAVIMVAEKAADFIKAEHC